MGMLIMFQIILFFLRSLQIIPFSSTNDSFPFLNRRTAIIIPHLMTSNPSRAIHKGTLMAQSKCLKLREISFLNAEFIRKQNDANEQRMQTLIALQRGNILWIPKKASFPFFLFRNTSVYPVYLPVHVGMLPGSRLTINYFQRFAS